MAPGGGKQKKVRQSPSNIAKNDPRPSVKGKQKLTTDGGVSGSPSNSKRTRTAALETVKPHLEDQSACHGLSNASSSTSSTDRSLGPTGFVRMDMPKDQVMPTKSGGIFQHAHHLAVNNSTMIDVETQNIFVPRGHSREALEWLEKYIMPGAEFNSSERDPPPRCHPGTRTTIIEGAQQWLMDHKREKNLLWLHGPAGVGKSAIVQTLVEAESEAARLGASLFFSRPNGRTNPQQVIPTIAYQLAVRDLSYRAYIGELMDMDPRSLDKAMNEQFRILIVEPFTQRHIRRGLETWLVALDGLDECGGEISKHDYRTQPAGRHSDRSQCEIVRLISDFTLQYPMVPLIWIIASRPEPHLKAIFSEDSIKRSLWEEEVPIDSEEACRDVEKFLHNEFSRISKAYPEHIADSVWPSNDHFLKIAKASSGLFAFADVIARFIDNPWVGNPIAQLDCVLSVLSKLVISPDQRNPFAALDRIYAEILSKIPPDMLQAAKKLIGTCIFLEDQRVKIRDCNFSCMCNILDITRDVAVTALRHLHSVLRMASVKNITKSRPRFYHASFRDYLEDPSRSLEYWIEKKAISVDLFWGALRFSQARFSHGPRNNARELGAARSFYGIPLSWPVEGRECDSLRTFVWSAFDDILCGRITSTGLALDYHNTEIFIPETRFWEFLEAVSPRKICGVSMRLGRLFKQLVSSSKTLEKRGFWTDTTLGSLDIYPDLDEKSVEVSSDNDAVYIQLDKMPSPDCPLQDVIKRREKLAFLEHCIRVHPQIPVKIIGHRDSDRSAMFSIYGSYSFLITGF